jgi:hypothetical protein
MEDSKQIEEDVQQSISETETEKYMELYEQEVWDEAIRSYNEVLFVY